MRVGILGAGKMGEMIIQGLKRSDPKRIYQIQATTRSPQSAKEIADRLSIRCHNDNLKLVETSDVIILCCKPQQVETILKSIQPVLSSSGSNNKKLLISICAAIPTQNLSLWSGEKTAVVRAMPNTPCLIGEGMTVLTSGPRSTSRSLKTAEAIFATLGKTVVIEEALMDGATGLSGCGPAYVYLIIEALSEAGVKVGLSRQTSTLLAAQTLAGAAQMVLQRGEHPAALKDEVTTPAGCTIDGLMALEDGKVRVALIKAVLAASQRSKALAS